MAGFSSLFAGSLLVCLLCAPLSLATQPPHNRHVNVTIVGAGLSGFYTALLLDDMVSDAAVREATGIDTVGITMLEAAGKIGGRARTGRFSGDQDTETKKPQGWDYLDYGGMRFPHTHAMKRVIGSGFLGDNADLPDPSNACDAADKYSMIGVLNRMLKAKGEAPLTLGRYELSAPRQLVQCNGVVVQSGEAVATIGDLEDPFKQSVSQGGVVPDFFFNVSFWRHDAEVLRRLAEGGIPAERAASMSVVDIATHAALGKWTRPFMVSASERDWDRAFRRLVQEDSLPASEVVMRLMEEGYERTSGRRLSGHERAVVLAWFEEMTGQLGFSTVEAVMEMVNFNAYGEVQRNETFTPRPRLAANASCAVACGTCSDSSEGSEGQSVVVNKVAPQCPVVRRDRRQTYGDAATKLDHKDSGWRLFEQGLGDVARAFNVALQDKVQVVRNATVVQVHEQGGGRGLELHTKAGAVHAADHVVMTPLPGAWNNIHFTTDADTLAPGATPTTALSGAKRLGIRRSTVRSSFKLGVRFSRRWWADRSIVGASNTIHGGVLVTDGLPRWVVLPSYPAQPFPDPETAEEQEANDVFNEQQPGVMLLSYAWGPSADQFSAISDDKAVELCLRDVVRMVFPRCNRTRFPTERALFDFLRGELAPEQHFTRWATEELFHGAFPGFKTAEYAPCFDGLIADEMNGRLHLGGETGSLHHGWVLGALNSGYRAALRVLTSGLPQSKKDTVLRVMEERWGEVKDYDLFGSGGRAGAGFSGHADGPAE